MANILVQNKVQASDVSAFNRVVKTNVAIENGQVFSMNGKSTTAGESQVWNIAQPVTATLSGLWMAYSPEVVVTAGKYKGIDPDPRNFTNVANIPFDCFKPKVGDILQLTTIGGTKGSNTFAVASNAEYGLQWASAEGAGLSLRLLRETTQTIGTGTIGSTSIVAYEFEVVKE